MWERFDAGKWSGIDLVLACGDLKSEYLQFVVTVMRVPVFYVRGNHDGDYDANPPDGCDDINMRLVKYMGLRIMGFEGSMWYNGKPHQYTEFQMSMKALRLVPRLVLARGVDIVVTHAPPWGIHDASDICHRGFRVFTKIIDIVKPKVFVHGHTHLGYYHRRDRETIAGPTKVIDAYGYYVFDVL